MKEHAEFIHDSFVDFEGKEHHFVMCALSVVLPKTFEEYKQSNFINPDNNLNFINDSTNIYWEIGSHIYDYGQDYYKPVTKGLALGVAICNTDDKFDLEVGKKIALNKAKNSTPVLYVVDPGMINTTMVQGFLKQEAEYLKDNPGKYSKSYKEKEQKYKTMLNEKAMIDSLSEEEKKVALRINEPGFLNKLLAYNKVWFEDIDLF